MAWERVAALERWVQGDLQPDLTLYFDLDPAVGRARTQKVRAPDRFEREQQAFYERGASGIPTAGNGIPAADQGDRCGAEHS